MTSVIKKISDRVKAARLAANANQGNPAKANPNPDPSQRRDVVGSRSRNVAFAHKSSGDDSFLLEAGRNQFDLEIPKTVPGSQLVATITFLTDDGRSCPSCGSTAVAALHRGLRCSNCGTQFSESNLERIAVSAISDDSQHLLIAGLKPVTTAGLSPEAQSHRRAEQVRLLPRNLWSQKAKFEVDRGTQTEVWAVSSAAPVTKVSLIMSRPHTTRIPISVAVSVVELAKTGPGAGETFGDRGFDDRKTGIDRTNEGVGHPYRQSDNRAGDQLRPVSEGTVHHPANQGRDVSDGPLPGTTGFDQPNPDNRVNAAGYGDPGNRENPPVVDARVHSAGEVRNGTVETDAQRAARLSGKH